MHKPPGESFNALLLAFVEVMTCSSCHQLRIQLFRLSAAHASFSVSIVSGVDSHHRVILRFEIPFTVSRAGFGLPRTGAISTAVSEWAREGPTSNPNMTPQVR